jgi:hypothetical protein
VRACLTVVNPEPSYFCRSVFIMGNSPVSFHGVIHAVAPYVYRNPCRAACKVSVIAHFNQNWIMLKNFSKTHTSFHENLFSRYSICFMCTERRIDRTTAKGASKGRERTSKHSFGSLVSFSRVPGCFDMFEVENIVSLGGVRWTRNVKTLMLRTQSVRTRLNTVHMI